MEQILLKAATTATDKGIFEAVISTSAPDREKDVVDPRGMVNALRKWAQTGKRIPLAWNHSGDPDKQIGYVEPESAKAIGSEVVVNGQIDLDSEVGQHAWRLVKAGTLGFSFGYLILKGSNIKGGGRNITELDVFEITATPTPMNNDTRVLAFKGAKVDEVVDEALEQAEALDVDATVEDVEEKASVRDEALELAREVATKDAPSKEEAHLIALEDERETQDARIKTLEDELAETKKLLESLEQRDTDADALRRAGEAVTLEAVKHARRRDENKDALAEAVAELSVLKAERESQNVRLKTLELKLTEANRQIEDLQSVTVDAAGRGHEPRSADPLVQEARALAVKFRTAGIERQKPPREEKTQDPELNEDELRSEMRGLMSAALKR